MKSLSCRDTGFNCDYVALADSNLELYRKGEEHAFNEHGIKKAQFIPEFNEKWVSKIRNA